MKKEIGMFILLVVLCGVVAVINPQFISATNLQHMARYIGAFGIFSIGAGIVIITGGIDLSVGSVLALQGVLLSIFLTNRGWPSVLAVLVVMVIGMGLGALHGALITKVGVLPFIVTLCGMLFYRGMAQFIAHDETKGFGDSGFAWLHKLGTGSMFGIPSSFILLVIISVLMWFVLHRSVYGRYLYAVGRNEVAARYSGISTRLVIGSAYVLAGLLTGVSAIVFAFATSSVQASTDDMSYELYGIAAAVLGGCSLRGGEGSIIGILIGTALLQVLQNLGNLLGIPSSLIPAVMGAVILIGVIADQVLQRRGERRDDMNLLGIDVGTGGTRAVIIDERGRIVAAATAEHSGFASPQIGWAEQDATDWWQATQKAVRAVLSQRNKAAEIACVGLSGQMHGATLLNASGEVLRPAIIWCDGRTSDQCRAITQRIGAERLIELVANPALAGFTLPKILWVREHEPDVWRNVRSVLLPKDYVRLQLTGGFATDVADASGTLLFDVVNRRWSSEMLSAFDIDAGILPTVWESQNVCGRVSRAGAAATGLVEGTPVVAGAGDQAAGAVGMGIVQAGVVSATIGTSGVVFAATDRPAFDTRGRVHTFCHAIPNRWHVMGVTQAAGLSLRWFRDTFGVAAPAQLDNHPEIDPYELLCAEAATALAGADGVIWTPYLMGERTPHLDPQARAALVGLTVSHKRAHIIRAILEGVAFSLRDTLTIFAEMNVPVETIRLGGGGARSPLWRQIQAQVYGRSVQIVEAEEGAAYGAALLAGVGSQVWPSVDDACAAVVRVASEVEPDRDAAALMNVQYEKFRALYPALQAIK